MKKIISLILTISILINFIFSSFSLAFDVQTINYTSGNDYSFSDSQFSDATVKNSPHVKLVVPENGVYVINMMHASEVGQFEIVDENGKVLELAVNKSTGNYDGSSASNNQVAVRLEAGKTYHLVGYYTPENGSSATYKITKSSSLTWDNSDNSGFASTMYSAPNITSEYGTSGLRITGRDARGGSTGGGSTGGGSTGGGSTGGGTSGGGTTSGEQPGYNSPPEDHSKRENSERVNFVQRAITWLFVRGIADQFKAFIVMLFGEVTIDKILFNDYPGTKLAFYKENGAGSENERNDFIENGKNFNILGMVNKFYSIFRGIAILFYIGFLLYIGIRILLKSTARDKDKYKNMLVDWFKGAIMLFYFPYVIKYSIILNEALVGIVAEVKNGNTELSEYAQVITPRITNASDDLLKAMGVDQKVNDKDIMMTYRNLALDTGSLVNALIYLFLLKELLGFILMYYKRVIMVLFLIVMFPFVCITYALDKIKDGQAQIFASWVKEFMLNVFLQFFQAMVYIAVMFIVGALMGSGTVSGANILLAIIGIRYIAKSDQLMRSLFPSIMSGGQGGTVKPLSAAVQKMTNVALIKKVGGTVGGMAGKVTNAKDKYLDFRDKVYEYRAEANRIDEGRRAEAETQRRVENADVRGDIDLASRVIPALPAFATGSAVEARKTAIDKKMQTLDDLAFARSNATLNPDYEAYMSTKTATERQDIERQIDAKESINEVLTGRDRSGRKLTDQELSIKAKVVLDVIRAGRAPGGPSGYKELHEWMQSKSLAVQEKTYAGGITVEQGKRLEAAGAKPRFRTAQRQVRLSDYLDADSSASRMVDVKTGKATTLRKGVGLAGRIVTSGDSTRIEQASRFVGGAAGVKTTKTDDLHTSFDSTTKRTKLDDPDALRLAPTSDAASDVISMSDDELYNIWDAHKGDIDTIVDQYGTDASATERGQIQEAAELLFQLQEYTDQVNTRNADTTLPPQAGVKSTEALRIASRLNGLSAKNKGVQALLRDSVSDGTTTATRTDLHVDLGFSLEMLETIAAQGVIHNNGSLSKQDKKEYTQLAVDTLSHDSEDSAVLAIQRRSENDDILGPNAPRQVGKDGKISRGGKTQEEIMEDVFEEEQAEDREKIASDALARTRANMIREGIKTAGAVASATIGVTVESASGIALASMTAGASDELELGGLLGSFEAGAGIENFAEKVVPGTVNTNVIGETIGNVESEILRGAVEGSKGFAQDGLQGAWKGVRGVDYRQRKSFERTGKEYDPNDPILVENEKNKKANARTNEIRNRLSNL